MSTRILSATLLDVIKGWLGVNVDVGCATLRVIVLVVYLRSQDCLNVSVSLILIISMGKVR